jgi:hypothetical protein
MSRRTVSTFGVILFLLVGGMALGQSTTGNLYGTVVDESGAPLPGVTVTVSGIGADRVQFTDAQGSFRILALDPGGYTVAAELDGFGGLEYPDVAIRLGKNTDLPLTLTAALEETITVTSESPLLDERQIRSGTNVSQIELEKIPTARDPWSILSQTPGVIVDRVNVGGSESGQQANFRAQGVSSSQNDFQMDGAEITDMRATGASPTYYDFDQFAEMSFTTGGTDVTKNSSGVQVNLVTKRGTNEFRGSTRFYNTAASGYFGGALKAAQPSIEGELHRSNGQTALAGARVRKIEDFGFEAGGAAIQDRLWFWGSWGQNNIGQNAASGTADDTVLENTVIKVNGQLNDSNSMVGSYNNGDKLKFGRGAGTTRPPATTWNQRGPSAQYRFEDQHIASANLFFTGTYSHGDFGFALRARGTLANENGLDSGAKDPVRNDGIWADNYLSGGAASPNDLFKVDGSYFFTTGASTNHELRFGGRYRTYENNSVFVWGPRQTWHRLDREWTYYARDDVGDLLADYSGLWVQDTISLGQMTINAGLRYDAQGGENKQYDLPAHPTHPELIPGVAFPGSDAGFSWESIAPRFGFTYALGEDRDTLVRASYSQFADQLPTNSVTRLSPLGYSLALVDSVTGGLIYTNVDPVDPLRVNSSVDSGLKAPTTTEILAGVEHSFLPELVVGFQITHRRVDDLTEAYGYVIDGSGTRRLAQGTDFQQIGTITGGMPRGAGSYSVPIYDWLDDVEVHLGSHLTNGVRSRDYLGYSLTLTKRLANRWMARGFFQYGSAEWNVPNSYFDRASRNRGQGGGDVDGQLYMTRSSGSGKGQRYLQSTWTYNVNGMYQVAPDRSWGFNVSADLTGREGSPIGYYRNVGLRDGGANINLVDDFNDIRLDDVNVINFRLEKEFSLSGPINLTFGIDIFNLTNQGTGLSYNDRVGISNAGNLADNIAPRIYRLGVRLNWR